MKKQILFLLTLVLVMALPFSLFANDETGGGDPTGGDGVCDTCTPAPIDGWLVVLLVVGAGYGFFKYRKLKKMAAV